MLARASGVSPRYLAEIETGRGNCSLAVLARVAAALELRVEQLVGEDDPWGPDAALSVRFRAAPVAARRA